MASALELRNRLQSLPQELYDQIYDETFAELSKPHVITNRFKAPNVANVNRAARARFHGGTFVVSEHGAFVAWLHHLRRISRPLTGIVYYPERTHELLKARKKLLGQLFRRMRLRDLFTVEQIRLVLHEEVCDNVSRLEVVKSEADDSCSFHFGE